MGTHQEVVPLNEEVEGGGQEFGKLGGAFVNIRIWVSGACRGRGWGAALPALGAV